MISGMYLGIIRPAFKTLFKVYLRDRWWDQWGKGYRNHVLQRPVHSLLFVCKGNICRSPFAEHIAHQGSDNNSRINIASAGLQVGISQSPPHEAVSIGKQFGVDLAGHLSQQVDEKMMRFFDLILVMEATQQRALRKVFPSFGNKVHLLSLYSRRSDCDSKGYRRYNILDPYGKGGKEFKACFSRIEHCVQNVLREHVGTKH